MRKWSDVLSQLDFELLPLPGTMQSELDTMDSDIRGKVLSQAGLFACILSEFVLPVSLVVTIVLLTFWLIDQMC